MNAEAVTAKQARDNVLDVCRFGISVLCTVGAGLTAVTVFQSDPTLAGTFAGCGSLLGAACGIVWMAATAILISKYRRLR